MFSGLNFKLTSILWEDDENWNKMNVILNLITLLLIIQFLNMTNDVLWDFQIVHLFSHYSENPPGRFYNKIYISWLVFPVCGNTIKQHFTLRRWCDHPLTIFKVFSIRLPDSKIAIVNSLVAIVNALVSIFKCTSRNELLHFWQ